MRSVLRGVGIVFLGLLLSVYAWWPMFSAYPRTQNGDGAFAQNVFEVAWASWHRYRELPLWNPYQCAGVPFWDNPQGLAASAILWLLTPFGATRGIELWIVIHVVFAFVSMWIFARHDLRVSAAAALFAACTWAFSGYYNQHLSGGHIGWSNFGYFPLALFFWRRAERDARCAVAMGMLFTWEMTEGGADALPHLGLLLLAETLTRAWPPRRVLEIARAGVIVLVVFFTLSACRTLPVIDQLRTHTRVLGVENDALRWTTVKDMFLAREHMRSVVGQVYAWSEYDAYVGPFVLTLAVIGCLAGGLEGVWLAALLVYAFALMLGHAGPLAPWSILREHVYPFKQMRVPSRFNGEVTLLVAALAAIGVDRGAELAGRIFRSVRVRDATRGLALCLAFIGVGDMIAVGIEWTATCFMNPASDGDQIVESPRLYVTTVGLDQFIDQPRQGLARAECWEEWAFHEYAPLWLGDVPQARPMDPEVATVDRVVRTQNTFSFDVNASRPTRILLNSGYDEGWRANLGIPVESAGGLLAVDVPSGWHYVKVKYWPRLLTLGFWLSGLSALGIAIFFVVDARWRRRARA